jgi:hypothetical protein
MGAAMIRKKWVLAYVLGVFAVWVTLCSRTPSIATFWIGAIPDVVGYGWVSQSVYSGPAGDAVQGVEVVSIERVFTGREPVDLVASRVPQWASILESVGWRLNWPGGYLTPIIGRYVPTDCSVEVNGVTWFEYRWSAKPGDTPR